MQILYDASGMCVCMYVYIYTEQRTYFIVTKRFYMYRYLLLVIISKVYIGLSQVS